VYRKPTKHIRKIVQSPEYVHSMSLKELGGWPDDRKKFNAEETTIEELELKPEETLDYLFDYGDEWWDEIIVEGIEESEEGQIYPRIIEKKGESPEQYLDTE
jgi:hypothetical protein